MKIIKHHLAQGLTSLYTLGVVQQCAEDDQPVETGVPFVKIHNVSSFVIQSLEMWQGSPFGRAGAGAPGAAASFESALFEHTTNFGEYLSAAVLEAETVCVRQAAVSKVAARPSEGAGR